MKKTVLLLLISLSFISLHAQITVAGRVLDEKKEPMIGAVVAILLNNVTVTGAQADVDGNYRITGLDPGTYDVEASLVGYANQRQTGVRLESGLNTVDFMLTEKSNIINTVIVREYKIPIIKVDQTQQGQAFSSEQLKNSPLKSVASIIASAAGVSSNSTGSEITIKGSRPGATDYYIDGVRVRNNYLPVADIEQLQVITGGLDARYGDVTGGVVSITTKGPASKFTGGIELESSKLFDKFNYNFVNANLAGPIWSRDMKSANGVKSKETIIGFRLSGQARLTDDPLPPAIAVYQVKPDVLAKLEAQPLTVIGNGTRVATAETLTADDFNALPVRPGNKDQNYNINGKLDFRLAKDLNFSLSGNYAKINTQFQPIDASDNNKDTHGQPWQVFNAQNDPWQYTNDFRFNARIRHRLGNTYQKNVTKESGTVIENAQYTLQAGFEQNNFTTYDVQHKDNLFDYGYVGKFNTIWTPIIGFTPSGFQHLGNFSSISSYTRSEINPILANYNNDVNINATGSNLPMLNGIYNNTTVANVFNFAQNVGRVYNLYQKAQRNTISFNATVSFDLIPNGNKKNAHNIEFGFNYEQRNNKNYSINPFSLWDLADRLQNQNLNGTALDTNVVIRDTTIAGQKIKIYAPALNTDIAAQTDLGFYKNYRKKFGLAANSYGNVNNLTPDQMSLDLFTARELNEQRLVNYNGYDYLGREQSGNITFNDFFTAKDVNGTRTFPIAANKPVYFAGYIQDKFRIGDLIVSAGIRVDRYDANNKVLKDPYSLYDIMTAKDFYTNILKQPKPDNIGDDYKVYLTSNTIGKTNYPYTTSDIRAYRSGDQWYAKNGAPQDPVVLFGEGTQTNAKYVVDTFTQIKQLGYDPSLSFTDYKPQTNIMPRLAFSFPISDIANFFAHYDVLVARPASNSYVSALNYYYFDDPGRQTLNNANLRPERTIDWEVGFQQKLTDNSGVKFAAYYKELKDMIQLVYYKYLPAPLSINQYRTYGNADFGTVKGFTFQYDLRTINHFSALINYTLQFADGTGSDANSQNDLNRKGNIRTLSPLNFDERHRFSFTFDYRYGDTKYDGPMLFNSEILSRAGINLQMTTVSGRPYTAKAQPQPFDGSQIAGDINGTRLPWTYNLDLRIDKTIVLDKNAKKPLNVNVYLRVQNVLNTLNIAQVYSASGSASNDGYLTSPFGVSTLANTAAERGAAAVQSYQVSYIQRLLNPDFYFLPRQMYLGATFDF